VGPPIVATAGDRPPDRSQQEQHGADHQDDDADGPENRDLEKQAQQQQDHTENDHLRTHLPVGGKTVTSRYPNARSFNP
jgi:hypothetical protein